jgi:hypothetical protein
MEKMAREIIFQLILVNKRRELRYKGQLWRIQDKKRI